MKNVQENKQKEDWKPLPHFGPRREEGYEDIEMSEGEDKENQPFQGNSVRSSGQVLST